MPMIGTEMMKDNWRYEIIASKCKGCALCQKACDFDAIEGTVKQPHVIDAYKCTRCGVCMSKCRFGAISKVSGRYPVA